MDFRKNDAVWWRCSGSKSKPKWIPKGRIDQAGVIKDIDNDTGYVMIAILNEERKEECYVVPAGDVRLRRMY